MRVAPAPENSGTPVQIKPKELGQFVHESPRKEPGYIEEVGQDDILSERWYAQ